MNAEVRLRKTGWTLTDSGCWEWRGTRNGDGYGSVSLGKRGTATLVHRLAYLTWIGPIATGFVVRHRCDNPPCMNPAHLMLGTKADNSRDMVARGRSTAGERNPGARLTAASVAEIRVPTRKEHHP